MTQADLLPKVRNRTQGNVHVPQTITFNRLSNGTFYANLPGIDVTSPEGDFYMSDWLVPDFARRRARGEVFFNSCWKRKRIHRVITGPGFRHWQPTVPFNDFGCVTGNDILYWVQILAGGIGTVYATGAVPLASIEEAQTETSTAVLNDRGRSDGNTWESLAEIHQAIDLLKHPLSSFNNWARKGSARRKAAKTASDLWLQYRYGLKPLISDVGRIVKGLQDSTGRRRKTSRSGTSLQQSSSTTTTILDTGGNTGLTTVYGIEKSEHVTVRAMSLDEINMDLAYNLGFDMKGLLTLPWELVPYSFVADWFFNVGDYIGSLIPALGVKQLGSCLTTKHVRKETYSIRSQTEAANYWLLQQCGSVYEVTEEIYERRGLNAPGLITKTSFGLDKGTRAGDALALIGQQILAAFSPGKTGGFRR